MKVPKSFIHTMFKNPEELTEPVYTNLQKRISYHIHLWGGSVMVPLSWLQYSKGNYLLSFLLALAAVLMALVVYFHRVKNVHLFKGKAFIIFGCALIIYSTYLNGLHGIIWAFPVTTAVFFLLGPASGLKINIVFIICLFISGLNMPETGTFYRALASLLLLTVFTNIFAWLVDNQRDRLKKQASTDTLTGCYNRLALKQVLTLVANMKARYGQPTSLIMMDIDNFKTVNDTYGHSVGDLTLVEISKLIQSRLRNTDILVRYGGEEFLAILPNTKLDEAETLAVSINLLIKEYTFPTISTLTLSMGVSELEPDENPDQCIDRSDALLYDAKRAGRNRVVIQGNRI